MTSIAQNRAICSARHTIRGTQTYPAAGSILPGYRCHREGPNLLSPQHS
jgi:hypothetical protein